MAYPTDSININRSTTITLPPEISAEIFAGVEDSSAVMQLGRKVALPGRGLSVPVVTAEPVAEMVAETQEKPVSNATLSTKLMTPQIFAVILTFSNQFRRDASMLYDELVRRAPAAIAKAFDAQALAGTAITGFDSLANCPTQVIDPDPINDVNALIGTVATAGYSFNGLAVSNTYHAALLTALDGIGRPLFVESAADGPATVGRVYGYPVARTKAETYAIGGDWNQVMYGIVDGINISYSEDATVYDGTNQLNLWQRNMFAVRIEAEMGFIVSDDDAFVRITAS